MYLSVYIYVLTYIYTVRMGQRVSEKPVSQTSFGCGRFSHYGVKDTMKALDEFKNKKKSG